MYKITLEFSEIRDVLLVMSQVKRMDVNRNTIVTDKRLRGSMTVSFGDELLALFTDSICAAFAENSVENP